MDNASNTLLGKVKKLIGVEPGTKLQPMVAYNSAVFFTGGGPYILGCYLLPFLTKVEGLDAVPESVSAEVDVLQIAENWSLFMSNDLPFSTVAKDLIPSSYQYEVATKYANGIDITFTSIHTLLDPAFVDEKVTNFVWITDNLFSVDISFVKRMLLSSGTTIEDSMNDRFYFVKYDDTNDYSDNPTWKLLSMKEIVGNAE